MIKNIIFDMGQVLLKFDPDFFIERAGINDKEDKEILIREIYKSLEWSRMDRGSLSPKEAAQIMEARVPEHLKGVVKELTCEWDRPIIPIQGSLELVKELKEKGYKLFLLSNAASNQPDYWVRYKGYEYFDDTIVSCFYNLVKPQPEIFKLALDKFNIKADETIFIDDSTVNCEGAYFSGIQPIVFHGDYQETRKKLIEFGVNVHE